MPSAATPTLGRPEIAPELRALAGRYGYLLEGADAERLRAHPRANVWSALEYACHVRDVVCVQRQRILQACTEEQPCFAPMRREERVLEESYNTQEPTVVSRELVAAADQMARTLEQLEEGAWSRTGVYSWPTTAVRTVDWIGRHSVHEETHHLRDMDQFLHASKEQTGQREQTDQTTKG